MRIYINLTILCFFLSNLSIHAQKSLPRDRLIDSYFQLLSKEKILKDIQREKRVRLDLSNKDLTKLSKLHIEEKKQLSLTLKKIRQQIFILEKHPTISKIAQKVKSAPSRNTSEFSIFNAKENE